MTLMTLMTLICEGGHPRHQPSYPNSLMLLESGAALSTRLPYSAPWLVLPISSVPILVGVQLLAHLETEVLQALKRLAHLRSLRPIVLGPHLRSLRPASQQRPGRAGLCASRIDRWSVEDLSILPVSLWCQRNL